MTGADTFPFGDDIPEADLAAQLRPVDDNDDNGLDPTQLTTARAGDADEADLIDQATTIAWPDDERDIEP